MKKQKRKSTKTAIPGFIFFFLPLVCLVFGGEVLKKRPIDALVAIICCIIGFHMLLDALLNQRYLLEDGIEVCRFGRTIRKLHWTDISQICVLKDGYGKLDFSIGNSSTLRIVIIPAGCTIYDGSMSGLDYIFKYRKQVIWLDHEKQYIEFLKNHYGEIIDWS